MVRFSRNKTHLVSVSGALQGAGQGTGGLQIKNPFWSKAQGVKPSETHLGIKYSGLMRQRDHLGFFGLGVLVSGKPFGLLDSSSTYEG